MKITSRSDFLKPPAISEAVTFLRNQIYRQARTGPSTTKFNIDSAAKAGKVFLKQLPAFECGEFRTWNQREHRVSASVEWSPEKCAFGFLDFNRICVFHDRLLGLIASQIQEREQIRAAIGQG